MSNGTPLRAGAARADITPGMGIQLAGDIGRLRPVEEIRERLYANALVVEHGGERLCVLSLDLLAMSCAWADRIRQGAAERYGLRPEAILVHVVQNHASPSIGHLFLVDEQKTRFPYEIQVFRIGDLSLVALMGEPFVEGQLEIKQKAPTRHTLVAHFCNGYAGYVPTRRAFAGGGYETRTGAGSKLPEDALERITSKAIQLLKDPTEGPF